MSQNQNIATSWPGDNSGDFVRTDNAPVTPSVPGPSSVPNRPEPARYPNAQFAPSQPNPARDAPAVQVESPEPPPWTDEDYVEYARARYGHQFTAAAARAFTHFDAESSDVQAAEFYRFRDAQLDMFGYF